MMSCIVKEFSFWDVAKKQRAKKEAKHYVKTALF